MCSCEIYFASYSGLLVQLTLALVLSSTFLKCRETKKQCLNTFVGLFVMALGLDNYLIWRCITIL